MLVQPRNSLRVEVPKTDNARLGRVGLIAVAGFMIGLVWPRLAGISLVPRVPNEKGEPQKEEPSAPKGGPAASAAGTSAPAPERAASFASPTSEDSEREPFTVGPGKVTECRGPGGKILPECDAVDFDAVALGRLATLSACEPVRRAHGVLSLGFELDFEKDRVTGVRRGQSSSIPEELAEALLGCLRSNLGAVSLSGIRHQHPRYTIFYRLDFSSGETAKKTLSEAELTPVSGKATVAWEAALIRSGPTREAPVVARVLQGTRVTVSARHGDWYRVKYDTQSDEGWVFRSSIGM